MLELKKYWIMTKFLLPLAVTHLVVVANEIVSQYMFEYC